MLVGFVDLLVLLVVSIYWNNLRKYFIRNALFQFEFGKISGYLGMFSGVRLHKLLGPLKRSYCSISGKIHWKSRCQGLGKWIRCLLDWRESRSRLYLLIAIPRAFLTFIANCDHIFEIEPCRRRRHPRIHTNIYY